MSNVSIVRNDAAVIRLEGLVKFDCSDTESIELTQFYEFDGTTYKLRSSNDRFASDTSLPISVKGLLESIQGRAV